MKLPPALARTRALPPEVLRAIVRIVALYAFFAALWILLSDRALGWLFADVDSLRAAGTIKGLLFVAVTSVLLFFLVLRLAQRYDGAAAATATDTLPRRGLIVSVALFSAVFLALAGGGIAQSWQQHRSHQGEFLRSVAELKAAQVEDWLAERHRDAEAARSTLLDGAGAAALRRQGDGGGRRQLLARLEDYRAAMGYAGVAVADAQGEILANVGAPLHETEQRLQATVREALAAGQVRSTDLFRVEQQGHAHVHFDLVAPLLPAPGLVLVLRVDVENSLFPLLQAWPTPSASAEVILFRRDGDGIVFLNELQHAKEKALTARKPLTDRRVLGVQALAPDYRPGTLLDGHDYRDVPVIGVARSVAGTAWWLVAKVDRDEAFGAARKESLWIGFSGLLTWFAALVLGLLFFQRRELQHAQLQRQEQAEKLRALQLLEAIANGSNDAIFAKDTAGRYLLFNREAERLTGKRAAEVLGHDDTALFPPAQAAQIMADDRTAMGGAAASSFHEALDTVDGKTVFLATKGPLRNADGEVVGVFGISRNITRLAETESALRQERDLHQRYLDTVQVLMVALDADGRVTMINRFGCDLLGYAEAELLGRNWFELCLVQPQGLEQVFPLFRRIMAGELNLHEYFENAVRCRDGRERLLAWHNALLTDDRGRIVGTLSSGEDITDRKAAAEAQQRQADELTARNAELERFNRAMVGRELEMIALKRRINDLSVELGRAPPYDLAAFADTGGDGE